MYSHKKFWLTVSYARCTLTPTVTILNPFPFRHIQIVLRIYLSPAEVLMGFDIDACSGVALI